MLPCVGIRAVNRPSTGDKDLAVDLLLESHVFGGDADRTVDVETHETDSGNVAHSGTLPPDQPAGGRLMRLWILTSVSDHLYGHPSEALNSATGGALVCPQRVANRLATLARDSKALVKACLTSP